MSVSGMQKWLEQSGFGEGFSSDEFRELRARFNDRLDEGADVRGFADEVCMSEAEFECVALAVVLVEDRGVAVYDMPPRLKDSHVAVKQYLHHTGEGARALTESAFVGAER